MKFSQSHRGEEESSTHKYTRKEIEKKIASVHWYHSFELVPGIITPGIVPFNAVKILDMIPIKDLAGKRILDIGAWDGPLSFELEKRGASVIAMDIQDPEVTGFNIAKDILQSQVEYIHGSVYDLSKLIRESFDVVFFFGVYYHLRNPILAFEEIGKRLAPQARLFFEGECLLHYAEDTEGNPGKAIDIEALGRSALPVALCYPGRYKNTSNWVVPNLSCIRSWLQVAGLELEVHYFDNDPEAKPHPKQRVSGIAKLAGRAIVEEHPIAKPDPLI